MSGKTSLAKLLKDWYSTQHPTDRVIVVSLLMISMNNVAEAEGQFRREWRRVAGFDFDDLRDDQTHLYTIIVDEAQRAYNLSEFLLWRLVKELQQGTHPNQRMLCLSGYTPALLANGLTTPVSFANAATLQLEDMRLHSAERADLFERLSKLSQAAWITPLPECMLFCSFFFSLSLK